MFETFDQSSNDQLNLVGLDIGSTTSSAMAASARLLRNCVTGRREIGEVVQQRFAAAEFTPFHGKRLDEERLGEMLDRWLVELGIDFEKVGAGGVIVTGFAAQAENAEAVNRLVRERIGEALIVTADDPCLESWVAFLGNSSGISCEHPAQTVINFDIGGGTSNVAWGRNGEVRGVGAYLIGARHLKFHPGTYELTDVSPELAGVLPSLGISVREGDILSTTQRRLILEFYVSALEAIATGDTTFFDQEPARSLQQVAIEPHQDTQPIITFSGGVGELAYRIARGESLPGTTAYGDLGIDFAQSLSESALFAPQLQQYAPLQLGRATLYGLTVHNTEISGSTLFLPDKDLLPLSDLPIVGTLTANMTDEEMRLRLQFASHCGHGCCLLVEELPQSAQAVKEFGSRLAAALREIGFPHGRPLVLLVAGNLGKTLGQYATDWGRLPIWLIVIDEIPVKRADFVSLGRLQENIVPLSFYGLRTAST